MRACFLVPTLARSGGIQVVTEHARRLREEHGDDAVVVEVRPGPPLDAALGGEWDVAVATWWTTIPVLGRLRASARGVLAQGFDPLHYRDAEFVDRTAAMAALASPFDVVAVSGWVADMVRALRPDARCHVVVPGVDKGVFGGAPRAASEGPLRILIDGQPSVWFKGVDAALAATGLMAQPADVTVVATEPSAAAGVAARVTGALPPAEMAGLYREADVVLKLSRFEGLGLVPVEAFHAGVPAVLTPYGGHAEYLRDGANGLLAGFDDPRGTAALLDRLAADRGLLAALGDGALATAADWPDASESTRALRAALGELGSGTGAGVAGSVAAQAAWSRRLLDELHEEVRELRASVEHERGRVRELDASRRELSALLERRAAELEHAQAVVHEQGMQLEAVRASRAYRIATSVRSVVRRRG